MPDNQFDTIKNLIKGAGLTLTKASDMLKMARGTLYVNMYRKPLERDFVDKVKEKLKLDLDTLLRHSVQNINTNNQNVNIGGGDNTELMLLRAENKHLKIQLEEKERLIQQLLNR